MLLASLSLKNVIASYNIAFFFGYFLSISSQILRVLKAKLV